MKTLSRTLAAVSAAAMIAAVPAPLAAAEDYDTALYDTLLDCTTLQVLFAQVADTQKEKDDAASMAVGFLTAANTLSGVEIKDLTTVITPRKAKILGWLDKKDGAAGRLTKSCAAIMSVHKNYQAASK